MRFEFVSSLVGTFVRSFHTVTHAGKFVSEIFHVIEFFFGGNCNLDFGYQIYVRRLGNETTGERVRCLPVFLGAL